MTAAKGPGVTALRVLGEQQRIAELEDEVQHLAGEVDRLQRELDAAHAHQVERDRIRTLDEYRGAIPRYHRQVW